MKGNGHEQCGLAKREEFKMRFWREIDEEEKNY
jgi:hypothetical protein